MKLGSQRFASLIADLEDKWGDGSDLFSQASAEPRLPKFGGMECIGSPQESSPSHFKEREMTEEHYHFQPAEPRAFKCYNYVGDENIKTPLPPTAVIVSTKSFRTKDGSWLTVFSCSLEETCHAYFCHYARKKLSQKREEVSSD